MQDNASFFIAIAISIAILMGFQIFYEAPRQKALQSQVQAAQILKNQPVPEKAAAPLSRVGALAETPRVKIDNEKIRGSINLAGGRIDDLVLERYRETINPGSPEITLFSPAGSQTPKAWYAEFGWLSTDDKLRLPSSDSTWSAEGGTLSPDHPVTLRWDNGSGLAFEREISIDKNYMFTVKEKVRNGSGASVTLFPFGLISRHGTPHTMGYSVLHEGPLGVLGGQLVEKNYKKLKDNSLINESTIGGWLGMTDIYWLAALVPPQDEKLGARFLHSKAGEEDRYQVDLQGEGRTIASGDSAEHTFHFFAGAKEVSLLDAYAKELNIPMFDKSVDFGWFYFIAKPFFFLIEFLARTFGNYGLAIIAFTILLRIAFFPLSESSYRSMARMKDLQPQMNSLRERFGNDPQKMNEELMKLYGKEKLNPMSGCLPVLVQIPVFFALYKVLLVSIEMRHAPFYGWVHDLSAPDPTNLFNLFGLLSFTPPVWIPHIGAWPILMGVTMFVQMKLSPQQPDKTMQMVFMIMPFMFMFMLANVSAGLVIYWTISNLLALAQQTLISHRAKKAK